jgi:hypothetical protein
MLPSSRELSFIGGYSDLFGRSGYTGLTMLQITKLKFRKSNMQRNASISL